MPFVKKLQVLKSSFYGGLLESFVVMECYKHMAWAQENMNLYHSRDKRRNEVDIVLEQDDGMVIDIEVKAANSVREIDFKGLKKLRSLIEDKFKFGIVFSTALISILYFLLPCLNLFNAG